MATLAQAINGRLTLADTIFASMSEGERALVEAAMKADSHEMLLTPVLGCECRACERNRKSGR